MNQMSLGMPMPPRPNPDAATARAERDAGMEAAAAGAEAQCEGWGDLALEWLRKYALEHASFISEEATDAARLWGLVEPSNSKAWGPVFKKAAKEGIIKRDGYGNSTRRHCSPTPRWRSQTYREAA
jgi:hypothetical protein